ncbi:hypothetical protein [Paraclostridium bifermentans]|uniref:hypothetical protein n=1 Tax=Paraclostridium bifermentans TaxID=1490 RepID=UPI0024300B58|nr:hypothetical protein [Paraclostridium bifermentans]
MNVVIVNCFDTYEQRVDLIYDYFKSKNCNINVVQSDFRHFQKIKRDDKKEDFIFVKSDDYYKNISVKRIKSHYKFAKDAFKIIEKIRPDLLYVMIPPNSLAKFANKYKDEHKDVKLYFDIIDLWPETMPMGNFKQLSPFKYWRMLRDDNLHKSECVIVECNLYKNVLKEVLKGVRTETLYLAKPNIDVDAFPTISNDEIHLCYLGSINNIIDIDKIKKLIGTLNSKKTTTLHIIGDGESKDILINEIYKTGSRIEYHGKVYDPIKKQKIFDKCHFGLNIMKDSVCVGLTMKSIDYFQHGLPIINNIKSDTTQIVEEYNIGFNLDESIEHISNLILNLNSEEIQTMKINTMKLFNEKFSKSAFNLKLDSIFKEMYEN